MAKSATNRSAAAAAIGKTPEGLLAGKIALLLTEGAFGQGREDATFIEAAALIREYGNERVREVRNAH